MGAFSKDVTSGKVIFALLFVTGFYEAQTGLELPILPQCWVYRLVFKIMSTLKKVERKNPVKGPDLGLEKLGVLHCQVLLAA